MIRVNEDNVNELGGTNGADWRGNEGYGVDYVDIGLPVIGGTIEDTGERCKMVMAGYWVGERGRHISSYVRVDKFDWKQYSMDRGHHFWIETDDTPSY